jgi:hypothetical protein
MRFPQVIWMMATVIAVCGGACSQADAAEHCDLSHISPPILRADDLKGIRTKVKFVPGDDRRYSIEPDTSGLPVADWYNLLEKEGVNLVEINLEPRDVLARDGSVQDSTVESYLNVRYSGNVKNNPVVNDFGAEVAASHRYTVAQRDHILIDFLHRLEIEQQQGSIDDKMKFIIHQRIWFRPGPGTRRVAMRQARTRAFVADMSGFINLARDNCLDHWLAGIRLGENGNNDMSSYLPILVDLAAGINAGTGGWLKSHFFLANGGGMGAEYKSINTIAPEFFQKILQTTGGFAFGYKWMQLPVGNKHYIGQLFVSSYCDSVRLCDEHSADDWGRYLGGTLGLNDLIDAIKAQHSRYPNHANVVFVGDSSDSVTQMVNCPTSQSLPAKPWLIGLMKLWPSNSDGWRGRVFMNGSIDQASLPPQRKAVPDCGAALFVFQGDGSLKRMTQSISYWENWPSNP